MRIARTKPDCHRRRNRHERRLSSISSLPPELLTEVVARVAAASSSDLFNAKLSCKRFKEIANDEFIFQRVSLENFPTSLWWPRNKEALAFFERCRKSGNPEALFRQGVVEYFSYSRPQTGLVLLERAAESGHIGATYVLGIILICSGEELREKGMELLRRIKTSLGSEPVHRRLKECRENLKSLNMWWKNEYIFRRRRPICCAMQKEHTRNLGWEFEVGDSTDGEDYCHQCMCDRQVSYFYNTFYASKTE